MHYHAEQEGDVSAAIGRHRAKKSRNNAEEIGLLTRPLGTEEPACAGGGCRPAGKVLFICKIVHRRGALWAGTTPPTVMRGLDPRIHDEAPHRLTYVRLSSSRTIMDGRVKPGHDN